MTDSIFQRSRDDMNEIRDHAIMSSRPLKYINDGFMKQRALKQTHPESIDVNSELRERPTRLNNVPTTNTVLFGTSAYVGSGLQDFNDINTETTLKFGSEIVYGTSRKRLTELSHYRPEFLNLPIEDDSGLRGKSTRTDMRNSYGKINSYKQRN
jgi:hypothetical protein